MGLNTTGFASPSVGEPKDGRQAVRAPQHGTWRDREGQGDQQRRHETPGRKTCRQLLADRPQRQETGPAGSPTTLLINKEEQPPLVDLRSVPDATPRALATLA